MKVFPGGAQEIVKLFSATFSTRLDEAEVAAGTRSTFEDSCPEPPLISFSSIGSGAGQ